MKESRFAAYGLLFLANILGGSSMLIIWTFFFVGSLNIVCLGLNETTAFVLNTCLCLAFFLQHSIMIRNWYRQWLAKFIREEYHGALYTITSGVAILILVLFWQESSYTLAAPQGILRWLMHGVYLLSIAGFIWGLRSLKSFDAFGLQPILRHLRNKKPRTMPFTIRGPYRWVRHPLYLFCLMSIWSCPDLTMDRLLFNILWTIWIVVGTVLEERDLAVDFCEEYRDYKNRAPMLIPRSIRPVQ